jgi:hypothetical protein
MECLRIGIFSILNYPDNEDLTRKALEALREIGEESAADGDEEGAEELAGIVKEFETLHAAQADEQRRSAIVKKLRKINCEKHPNAKAGPAAADEGPAA